MKFFKFQKLAVSPQDGNFNLMEEHKIFILEDLPLKDFQDLINNSSCKYIFKKVFSFTPHCH